MHEQEFAQHITSLQARMNRMEAQMQQLLLTLTSSGANGDKTMQMQNILQELRGGSDAYSVGSGGNSDAYSVGASASPATFAPQEAPEIKAIRDALLSGNKIKAIALYRAHYNVDLRTAKAAVDSM